MRACLLYMKSYNIREGKGDDGDNSAVTELIEAEHGFNPGVVFGGMMGGFTALESHTHAEFIELVSLLACVLRDMGMASAMMEGFDDLPKQQASSVGVLRLLIPLRLDMSRSASYAWPLGT